MHETKAARNTAMASDEKKRPASPPPENAPVSEESIPEKKAKESKPAEVNAAKATTTTTYKIQERIPVSTLQDLRGMDEIQEKLKHTVILPFAHPPKAAAINISVPRGILFTGVPGTGKTALADAIVNEIRKTKEVKYYQETGASIHKAFGGSQKNVQDLFKIAKENAPSIIFLDELSCLEKQTDEGRREILKDLFTEISAMVPGEVLLIAATNSNVCDPALIQKGRFDMIIDLPTPNQSGREEIIQHYFGGKGITLEQSTLEEIAERTNACTGNDLMFLVDYIYGNVVKRVFPNGSWALMEAEEFGKKQNALQEVNLDMDVKPALIELEKAKEFNKYYSGNRIPSLYS